MTHEHHCYGLFPGGDPRRFKPDEQDCMPEEIEKHKAACAAWDAREAAGESNEPVVGAVAGELPGPVPGGGKFIACGVSGFGIGVYSIDCDDPECPEAQAPPDDPEDGNAAFARWWNWDGPVLLADEKGDEARLRVAFLAGFRAREEEREHGP